MTHATSTLASREVQHEVDIRPLQPAIGAEIHGVDISKPLDPALRQAILDTLTEYKVVFFRDQALDNAAQTAFAAQFGRLYTHPSPNRDNKIQSIHKIAAADFKKAEHAHLGDYLRRGDVYHSDTSWRLDPAWGAVLRAVDLPPVGGDTIWVDANLAYEGLSDTLKARIDGLYVTHDFRRLLAPLGIEYPIVAHPVVRTHPVSGRKILWVNSTLNPQILGLELAESRALVAELVDHYKRPEYQVRFVWQPGSVAFWDNRATMHYAVRNYGEYPRVMERVLIADEPVYGPI
ncbi:TauD/TfdA dioxygenase family protein [Sphingomonas sp. ID0503]|uniref:TauD/TfdA dioxygenase family protein n=1 Tax=Sphingomonas sp. ID0503 TaxID=3399691 RepID=UPI003AFA2294